MKRTVRLFSVAMALVLLVSAVATFGVSARETGPVSYAEANDGDTLYTVDFNGIQGVWEPTGSYTGWDTMSATVDGSSVTLVVPQADSGKNRALWGAEFSDYQVAGNSFTVEFTVKADDAKQSIGLFLDKTAGFILTPGQNKYSVGQYSTTSKIHADDYYFGTADLEQTYAVEVSVATETHPVVEGQNTLDCYAATAYNLYVKIGGAWQLVCSLDGTKTCNSITDQNELGAFEWEEGAGLSLAFYRAYDTKTDALNVTVKDVTIKKGLVVGPTAVDNKKPASSGTLTPTGKNDGDLLYTVNFNGDANFTPGTLATGYAKLDAKVDAANSGKVTLSVPAAENGSFHFFGGEFKGLTLANNVYTVFLAVERSKDTSPDTDPILGVSLDGAYYAIGDSSYMSLTWGINGGVRGANAYAGNQLFIKDKITIEGSPKSYKKATGSFTQYLAIEINGADLTNALRVYAMTTDGKYQLVSSSPADTAIDFMSGNLSLYFYQKAAGTPVVVSDVRVYKGATVESYNATAGNKKDDTTGGDTTTTNEVVTTNETKTGKSGCASALTASTVIVAALVPGMAVIFSKKKKMTYKK